MAKKVTLTATTLVNYAGKRYGAGMQFDVEPEDVKRLTKSGEAVSDPKAAEALMFEDASDKTVEAPKK